MRLSTLKSSLAFLIGLALIAMSTTRVSTAPPPPLPNPILILIRLEPFKSGGKELIRYKYEVVNRDVYPNGLFAAAPELPPCGSNTKASRTWVDIFDQSGKRLQGFCALGKNDDLNGIWFAMESDVVPPSWVYVEMNDRQTNTKYKSNLAETVE